MILFKTGEAERDKMSDSVCVCVRTRVRARSFLCARVHLFVRVCMHKEGRRGEGGCLPGFHLSLAWQDLICP